MMTLMRISSKVIHGGLRQVGRVSKGIARNMVTNKKQGKGLD
jgi:hypothetical protein